MCFVQVSIASSHNSSASPIANLAASKACLDLSQKSSICGSMLWIKAIAASTLAITSSKRDGICSRCLSRSRISAITSSNESMISVATSSTIAMDASIDCLIVSAIDSTWSICASSCERMLASKVSDSPICSSTVSNTPETLSMTASRPATISRILIFNPSKSSKIRCAFSSMKPLISSIFAIARSINPSILDWLYCAMIDVTCAELKAAACCLAFSPAPPATDINSDETTSN